MRIIAGEMRSRRLKAPEGMDTRPTADRVKEALFSILSARLYGARVLDLYAGSGALALEALSRGAQSAVLVDCAGKACQAIRENIAALQCADRAQLLRMKDAAALTALCKSGDAFDIVFLDPPYASGYAADAVQRVFQEGILNRGGTLIVEHAWDLPPALGEGRWQVSRVKRYGACGVTTLIWRERQ